MGHFAKTVLAASLFSALCVCAIAESTTIRSVSVLGAGDSMEVEVIASGPVTAQTQVATGPDRLIIDFPNATPGEKLRNVQVNRGELKGVRVGLFSAKPPVTRVVLDLKTPQQYQLFPSGKTMIVKLHSGLNQTQAAIPVSAAPSAPPVPPPPPPPKVSVEFHAGNLKIWADRATLAEVLAEVRRRTGAEVNVPPGGGQEQIVANLGPAPARDVLASLLNGSQFNFVILGSDRDPAQLRALILTTRGAYSPGSSVTYPAIQPQQAYAATPPERGGDPNADASMDPPAEPEPQPQQQEMTPNQPQPQ